MKLVSKPVKTINRRLTPPPELRRKAEDLYKWQRMDDAQGGKEKEKETPKMLYELQVRKLELEIQNEELNAIREHLDAGLERFADLYNFSPVGSFTLDDQGRIIEANLTGEIMLNVTRERFLGRNFIEFVAAQDRPVLQDFMMSLLDSHITHQCDLQLLKNQEAPLYVHIEGLFAPEVASYERQVRLAVSDITVQKQYEQARMTQSRMEATATLAGGIAHDFNNLMSIIMGNTELLQLEYANKLPIHSRLSSITEAARKASELTDLMIAYARGGKYSTAVIDINEIIRSQLDLRIFAQMRHVRILPELTTGVWKIEADLSQINMVVMILLMNAVESIAETGNITISTRNWESGRETAAPLNPTNIPPGRYVNITVADTGCGMTPEVMAKIFEPFYTTKFQGRGLGLAAAHGIVRNHQGHITVESDPGRGSRFMVFWPAL